MRQTELEEMLNKYYVGVTDKILYFPCRTDMPDTIELKYMWNKIKKVKKSLLVSTKGKPYMEIARNVCEGLMGFEYQPEDFWNLSNNERKKLYNIITENPLYQNEYYR